MQAYQSNFEGGCEKACALNVVSDGWLGHANHLNHFVRHPFQVYVQMGVRAVGRRFQSFGHIAVLENHALKLAVLQACRNSQISDGITPLHFLDPVVNRIILLRNYRIRALLRVPFIETAVAYIQATGKGKFLDIVCRLADHIDSLFGPEARKNKGYPGHQEIELRSSS